MDTKVGGQIHGISLSAFLQMSEMEDTTCTLKVMAGDKVGHLYMLKGELIAAEMGDLKDEQAAYEIISWEESTIDIEEKVSRTEKKIKMPLMNILMEGAKIRDEKSATKKKQEAPAKPSSTHPTEPPPLFGKTEEPQLVMEKQTPGTKPESKSGATFAIDLEAPATKAPATSTEPGKKAVKSKKTVAAPIGKGTKKLFTVSVILVATIAILLIGLITWFQIISPMIQKKEFDKVMAEVGVAKKLEQKEKLLRDYIDTHGLDIFIPKAEEKLEKVLKDIDNRDFKDAMTSVDNLKIDEDYLDKATGICRRYLARHPDGLHTSEVKKKINDIPGLVDDDDYERLKNIEQFDYDKKILSYNRYLKQHPDGKHVKDVKQMLSGLSEVYYTYVKKEVSSCNAKKDWNQCIITCNTFIENYEDSKRIRTVRNILHDIHGKADFTALKEEATLKGTDYYGAVRIYEQYLEKNPNSSIKKQIKSELAVLGRKIVLRNEFNELSAFCKNRHKDIFGRIDKLDRYINKNPSGQHTKTAKKLMVQLEKEEYEFLQQQDMIKEERLNAELKLAAMQRERQRLQSEKDKIIEQLKNGGKRYKIDPEGVATDTQTGLMWQILDSYIERKHCMGYEEAKSYVEKLDLGGYNDWRLPTPNDLMVIFFNKPYFPAGEAIRYWTSEAYWRGSHEMVTILHSTGNNRWQRKKVSMGDCCSVRAVRP
jgi:hypothetical protein